MEGGHLLCFCLVTLSGVEGSLPFLGLPRPAALRSQSSQ